MTFAVMRKGKMMSKKLIYAEDAIKALEALFVKQIKQFGYDSYEQADEKTQLAYDGMMDALTAIYDISPSAQPETVRCKDCKHWGRFGYCTYGTRLAWIGDNNDFCSKGERRTDGVDS